ncbi:hypothetical protein ACI77I_11695 [Pseudomonas sp. D47]|uniref:hypothetical protein n=1 Tax=Pseudomonas sp. D47 TaxID=3159447 RepID=UPI00387B172C
MSLISIGEARAAGATTYFTGKPCKHGHVSMRVTANGTCIECAKVASKKIYEKGAEAKKQKQKAYYSGNREKRLAYACAYREANKDKANQRHGIRYASDPEYRMYFKVRRILRRVSEFAGRKQAYRSSVLGYCSQDLASHIESKFLEGMNWGNAGDWHVDHIKPIASFFKEGITDPAVINALSNLQPLWAEDNLRKGSRYSVSAA